MRRFGLALVPLLACAGLIGASPASAAADCGVTPVAGELNGIDGTSQDLWAVGRADGPPLTMHWDGSAWTQVPAPGHGGSTETQNEFEAVSVLPSGKAWAVGHASIAYPFHTVYFSLIERWNGSQWRRQNSGTPLLSDVVALSNHDVWAVGGNTISHYDGTTWSTVAAPATFGTLSLTSIDGDGPNDVWAAGGISGGGAVVIHWDGSAWSIAPTVAAAGPSGFNAISATGPDDVWAVGSVTSDSGSSSSTFVEHWDGSSWTIVPSPAIGDSSVLRSVTETSSGQVWAAGYSVTAGQSQAIMLHWAGSEWTQVGLPGDPATYALNGVKGFDPGDVWAAGDVIVHVC